MRDGCDYATAPRRTKAGDIGGCPRFSIFVPRATFQFVGTERTGCPPLLRGKGEVGLAAAGIGEDHAAVGAGQKAQPTGDAAGVDVDGPNLDITDADPAFGAADRVEVPDRDRAAAGVGISGGAVARGRDVLGDVRAADPRVRADRRRPHPRARDGSFASSS